MKLTNSLLVVALLAVSSSADEKAEKPPEKAAEVSLTGIFESVDALELKADTEELTSLEVQRIVEHGATVKKGQTIVSFDAESVDEKLEAAEDAMRSAELTFAADEFAMDQFQATQKLDHESAERTWAAAERSFDNFQQTDRDRLIKSAEFSLKNSEASLANAMEELKQLEQMYREDELTEESEEIVLKRAKQTVENALFRLEGTKISTERTISQTIPVRVAEEESRLRRAELAFERAKHDLKIAAQKKELEMKGKVKAFEEKKESLEKLKKERRELTISAPFDGLVYYGALTRGRLSDKPSTLKAESKVTGQQVIATLVNPSALQIRTTLSAGDVKQVKVGQEAEVTALATDAKFTATVKSVSRIPYANNKFDCVLSFEPVDGLIPATSCSVKITIGE